MKIPEPKFNCSIKELIQQYVDYVILHAHITSRHHRVFDIGSRTWSPCGYYRSVLIGAKLLSFSRTIKSHIEKLKTELKYRRELIKPEDCISCKENQTIDCCKKSPLRCGHHSNESWTEDYCSFCKTEFGENS